MRINCIHCASSARILTRRNLSIQTSDFYCECQKCGFKFVSTLSFKHALDRPDEHRLSVFRDLLRTLTPKQRDAYAHVLREFV